MITNNSTRRMQIAVSSNICGFLLLLCLGSCTLDLGVSKVSSVGLVDRSSGDWMILGLLAGSTSGAWRIFPVPHFFWSASSSRVGEFGSNSRLVCWQWGQVQSLDLVHKGSSILSIVVKNVGTYREANLFLSPAGYSMDPTPTAACPFKGKKPWRPRIAG